MPRNTTFLFNSTFQHSWKLKAMFINTLERCTGHCAAPVWCKRLQGEVECLGLGVTGTCSRVAALPLSTSVSFLWVGHKIYLAYATGLLCGSNSMRMTTFVNRVYIMVVLRHPQGSYPLAECSISNKQ